jgi:hypothetical protein
MQSLMQVNCAEAYLHAYSCKLGKLGETMSNKDKKRQQRQEYHRDFKTGDKTTRKKREKSPGRKVK